MVLIRSLTGRRGWVRRVGVVPSFADGAVILICDPLFKRMFYVTVQGKTGIIRGC